MGLVVWLPLTKDLRQQGLSDTTVTNNGATYSATGGKLGGCYSFNGSSNYLYTTGQGYFGNNYSFSVWVYTTSTSATQTIGCIRTAVGSGFSLFLIGGKLRIDPGGNNVQWTTSYTYPANTWFHLVVTYDGTTVKYYIDGEYKQSYTATISSTYWGNTLSFGASQANGSSYGNYLNGRLNDIRLYDHCLSPMEVKELAKGLVLHYPLNRQGWGQDNIIPGTNLGTANWYWTMQAGNYTAAEETTLSGVRGCKFTRGTTAQSGWSVIYYNNINESLFKTSTAYKLSVDIYPSVNTNFVVSIRESNGTNVFANATPAKAVVANKWNHLEFDLTTVATLPSSTGETIYFQSMDSSTGVSYIFRNLKLEEGSIATPWCPNSSDTLATTMGLNGTTEYDCSGFCNNGTRTGTFSWTSDTPKYNVSTHISSTSSKIHISNFPTSGFGNTYSFAWWGKRSSNSPMFWGFSDGIRLNGMHTGTLWNTGDSSDNPIYKPNTTTIITAPSVNVWHHYVMTGNGSICKLYVDGELYGQAKTYKAISGTSIYINGWDSSTSYCSDNTDISDFRIYATALSADDVKSLYQNSAYIDSSGNVYGAVHSEV